MGQLRLSRGPPRTGRRAGGDQYGARRRRLRHWQRPASRHAAAATRRLAARLRRRRPIGVRTVRAARLTAQRGAAACYLMSRRRGAPRRPRGGRRSAGQRRNWYSTPSLSASARSLSRPWEPTTPVAVSTLAFSRSVQEPQTGLTSPLRRTPPDQYSGTRQADLGGSSRTPDSDAI